MAVLTYFELPQDSKLSLFTEINAIIKISFSLNKLNHVFCADFFPSSTTSTTKTPWRSRRLTEYASFLGFLNRAWWHRSKVQCHLLFSVRRRKVGKGEKICHNLARLPLATATLRQALVRGCPSLGGQGKWAEPWLAYHSMSGINFPPCASVCRVWKCNKQFLPGIFYNILLQRAREMQQQRQRQRYWQSSWQSSGSSNADRRTIENPF